MKRNWLQHEICLTGCSDLFCFVPSFWRGIGSKRRPRLLDKQQSDTGELLIFNLAKYRMNVTIFQTFRVVSYPSKNTAYLANYFIELTV